MNLDFKKRKADLKLFYKTIDGVDLPIHMFFPDRDIHQSKAVLLIHGGGWTDAITDNSEWNGGWLSNNAKYLAENGFLSIVISYRSLKLSEALTVPDLLEDCIDAIKYLRKNFSFVNFEEITFIGESAGGYFATMLGLSQNDELRPQKVVAANPVLYGLDAKWKYGFKGLDDIRKFTPINCIGEKASEFLFLHGTEDNVVKIEDTEKMHYALLECGHNSDMLIIPKEQHAFMLYDYRKTDEFVTEIMNKIIDFITEDQRGN